MTLRFDHIAFTAPSREAGRAAFADATGVMLPDGGEHPAMGTHNALAALGPESFIEIIAINPDAPFPNRPRWFGLNTRPNIPALGPPILLYRTNDLDAALAEAQTLGFDIGAPLPLSRGALTWRFAVRSDGSLPPAGAPILLQWTHDGPHPAGAMADPGLRLESLTVTTPVPDALAALLEGADTTPHILEGDRPSVTVTLSTPDGRRVSFS